MAEKVEDLNLPASVVTRIIKESLPSNANVSKEARVAVAKAASIFVLYLTSTANNIATQAKRKTISGQDVLKALTESDFEQFVEVLEECLDTHKKILLEKQKQRAAEKSTPEKRETNGDASAKISHSPGGPEEDEG